MLDEVDFQIIELLQDNARLSNAAIAQEVGLTVSTIHERVKKLEKKGVITGYVALINAEYVNKPITAFIRLMLSPVSNTFSECKNNIVDFFKNEPDILEAHSVAGEDCYIIKVKACNTMTLEELIERIRDHVQITRSVTNIVLTTFKETSKLVP